MKFETLSASLVNDAVDIYLRSAYDDADARSQHAVSFDDSLPIRDVLAHFDRTESPLRAYALRLGSGHYPHMKLLLRECYYENNFAFSVDRHDEFAFETGDHLDDWRALQQRNYALKREIEDAWYKKGIPTPRTLREKLLTDSDMLRAREGRPILIVDNDEDGGPIQEMLLQRAGYECHWVRSLTEVEAFLKTAEAPHLLAAVVDMLLNDGTGQDVIRLLRSTPATENIPILLTSAIPEKQVDRATADRYLPKPHTADKLIDTIAELLRTYDEGEEGLIQK